MMVATLKEHFDSKWVPEPNTGCHLWTGRGTYGLFRYGASFGSSHRIAWEIAHGPIPPGMHVCHRCDTPGCVNVEHLFIGTKNDNMADAVRKGRMATGSRHGSSTKPGRLPTGDRHWSAVTPEKRVAGDRHWSRRRPGMVRCGSRASCVKLDEARVSQIRAEHASGVKQADLVRRYGVSQNAMSSVLLRKTWKHVEGPTS